MSECGLGLNYKTNLEKIMLYGNDWGLGFSSHDYKRN
jgi:hypothetical protein